VKHECWGRFALPIELDDRQLGVLEAYEGLLRDRAMPLGIVAPADAPRLRERHLLDCLRAAQTVGPDDVTAYDLGSGAGLPGVVVGIACPGLHVTLVERRRSRAAFLELVVERLKLGNVSVFPGRAQDLMESVDLCFARAFADPVMSWSVAEPRLLPRGRLAYFAGEGFEPSAMPDGVVATIVPASSLARSGLVVIMSRQ